MVYYGDYNYVTKIADVLSKNILSHLSGCNLSYNKAKFMEIYGKICDMGFKTIVEVDKKMNNCLKSLYKDIVHWPLKAYRGVFPAERHSFELKITLGNAVDSFKWNMSSQFNVMKTRSNME